MTKAIGYGAGNRLETADDASSLSAATLPVGIDAAKIADGSVSNAEFQYLSTVSSDIQTQLNGKLATNGDAGSLTNIPAGQLAGNVARARISTALAAGGDPVTGTEINAPLFQSASTATLNGATGSLLQHNTLYDVNQRPPGANQMCILVANPDHSVNAGTGNCMELP